MKFALSLRTLSLNTALTSKKSHRQRDDPACPRAPPDPRDRRPGGPRHLMVHHGRRRGRVQHQVPQLCRWDVTRDIEKLLTRYICQISRRVLRCVSVTMPMTTQPTSTRPSVSWTSASAYSMPVLTEGEEWHLVTSWTYVHFFRLSSSPICCTKDHGGASITCDNYCDSYSDPACWNESTKKM